MTRSMNLRTAGGLLVLSTPVSGIVCFAALAVALGEGRLENADGLTALGWVSIALAPLAGLVLIAWSFSGRPAPAAGGLRLVGIGIGLALVVLGLVALLTGSDGDPSIGGGLLILVGLGLAAAMMIGRGRPAPV